MEHLSSQTEKISTYETSRTRLSLMDGNNRSDSNNEDEFQMDGFYVREKSEKRNDIETVAELNTENAKSDVGNSPPQDVNGDDVEDSVEHNVSQEENNDSTEKNDEDDIQEVKNDDTENSNNDNITQDVDSDDSESGDKDNIAEEVNNDNIDDSVKDDKSEEEKSDDVENCESEDLIQEEKADDIDNSVNDNEIKEVDNEEHKNVRDSMIQEHSYSAEDPMVNKLANGEPDIEKTAINKDVVNESREVGETEDTVNNSEDSVNIKNNEDDNNEKQTVQVEKERNNDKVDLSVSQEKKSENINSNSDIQINSKNIDVITDVENDEENKEETSSESKMESESDKTEYSEKETKPKEGNDEEITKLSDSNEQVETSSSPKEGIEEETNANSLDGEIVTAKDAKVKKSSKRRRPSRNVKKSKSRAENKKNRISILKEQLQRREEPEEMSQNDIDMDEDFDPSLLCPDISMDVDEALIITNTEGNPEDGKSSPLPYEPVFSELVDEITGAEVEIDLTPEELELKRNMFSLNNPVQHTKVHCTACNLHLGSALTGANNRFVHPLLKVLICKNCYHFYTSGEFEKDEDGSELYCRWCGQGGQVLCCSSCEYVFCKRCIRNNFGQRKFKEIRDSDDWNCFRCDPAQLSYLRASCSEFMDYYRKEMSRVQTLAEQQPELMTTDYTKCCNNAEPKTEEPKPAPPIKSYRRKRKDSSDDPDYKPVADEDELPKKILKFVPTTVPINPGTPMVLNASFRPLLPKLTPANPGVRQIVIQPQSGSQPRQMFRVGNTTFRAKSMITPRFAIQRPTLIPSPNKQVLATVQIPNKAVPTNSSTLKHEWFEKTVRAAARVNSNLSYTLTQLNRQQSQANNVEALAVVHNKLQEVLSSSINSLIQIRKNLRTEFIAGIKNVKFPQNTTSAATPIVVKDDDDVIIVNSPTSISGPKLTSPPPLIYSSAASSSKRNFESKINNSDNSKPSTSTTTNSSASTIPKGGFLKVRSFSALQNVTSECITIPDDPPLQVKEKPNENGKLDDEPVIIDDVNPENGDLEVNRKTDMSYMDFVYNVTQEPNAEVQKMMNVVIKVKRSRVVDEIMRMPGLLNRSDTQPDNS